MPTARHFAELARTLSQAGAPEPTAQAVTRAATSTLGCAWAGIIRRRRTRAEFDASDPELVPGSVLHTVTRIINRTGEGPALDVLAREESVVIDDLATDDRWPRYAAEVVARTPVRTILMFHLALDDTSFGALGLYHHTAGHFTPERCEAAAVLADHAAIALARAADRDTADNLRRALESSRQIGTALGILMARYRVTEDDAFDLMRTASQRTHRKLRDVAVGIIDTGDLAL